MRFPRPRTRRAWLLLGIGALLVVGGAGAVWFDRYYPWYHFRTVVPGVVYRAGQPDADDVALAVRRYGIKTIVNLRAEPGAWHEAEKAAAAKAGIAHVDVPLPVGTPPTPEQVAMLLAISDDPARVPILFHCEYGTVRSAAVEALYRMEVLKQTNEEAWDATTTFGKDLDAKYPLIPQFVRTYRPRWKR
jgi:protein tyrosine phosphatase (PTP) superfamily phosphohydrolase (DUF442 family)